MKIILISLFASITSLSIGQNFFITKGDISKLKGENSLNIEFTYENMFVGELTEVEYLDKKVKEMNDKEPEKGNRWKQKWVEDREQQFEPKFIELSNKPGKLAVAKKREAKYTLIFNTTRTEPGFNAGGFIRKNSEIDAVITIVETANRSNIIAEVKVERAPGRGAGGFDFDTGYRLSEAYAVSGKRFRIFLKDIIGY